MRMSVLTGVAASLCPCGFAVPGTGDHSLCCSKTGPPVRFPWPTGPFGSLSSSEPLFFYLHLGRAMERVADSFKGRRAVFLRGKPKNSDKKNDLAHTRSFVRELRC